MAESKKGVKKHNKLSIVLIILISIVLLTIVLELITGVVSTSISNVKHAILRNFGVEAKEGNTPRKYK